MQEKLVYCCPCLENLWLMLFLWFLFTPRFIREIGTLSHNQISLPDSCERFGHFLITRSHSQFLSTSLKTKLEARPGDQEVSKSVKRNREWDKLIGKCLNLTISNICLHWVTVTLMLFSWFLFTHRFIREIGTLSHNQISLPVSFERFGHFLITRSHSQFRSRDLDTSWSPCLTPCFVWQILTLPEIKKSSMYFPILTG
jgi:hypothetical protein